MVQDICVKDTDFDGDLQTTFAQLENSLSATSNAGHHTKSFLSSLTLDEIPSQKFDDNAQRRRIPALAILNALPNIVLVVDGKLDVLEVNAAAEAFFDMGSAHLRRRNLTQLIAGPASILDSVRQVLRDGSAVNEYHLVIELARLGGVSGTLAPEHLVDIHIGILDADHKIGLITIAPRAIAEQLDRHMTNRSGARSVSALAAMLAHEVKNPLAGIRGAAQLLDSSVSEQDRALTNLICTETDRIVSLLSRVEVFSDGPMLRQESVNIHKILDGVKQAAKAGFARHIHIRETYDPSLPNLFADSDLLTQVFLNLVKNAAEAIGETTETGEIELTTAFRPGLRMKMSHQGSYTRGAQQKPHEAVSLPLEFCVHDNGGGIAPDVMSRLFDPFVTTKANGNGLGLAMVSKIIADHGGLVECESFGGRTTFRILMPMYREKPKSLLSQQQHDLSAQSDDRLTPLALRSVVDANWSHPGRR